MNPMPHDHVSGALGGRSRTVSRALVVAGVAVVSLAALGGVSACGAASASGLPVARFFSGDARFTVGGHTWILSVSDAGYSVDIDISTGREHDSWSITPVPAADFKANDRTGSASLNTRNALAPLAFLKITFAAAGRRAMSCRSGTGTIFTGTATGSVTLLANYRGLRFRSAHARFRGGKLILDRGCVTRVASSCFAGSWFAPGATIDALGNTPGLPGRRFFDVTVDKHFPLKAPLLGNVYIDIVGRGIKPVFNSKKKELSVRAGPHGPVTGSAVLSASAPRGFERSSCTLDGQHFKDQIASYRGTYVSPKGGQFRARSLVAGLLQAKRTGFAEFIIVTLRHSSSRS
jgi:hypothetical protein